MARQKQIAALLVASLISAQVVAAPVTLPQTLSNGFGSTTWDLTDTGGTSTSLPYTGSCDGTTGDTVQDASGPTGAGDAYDNAWNVWVNNTKVAQNAGDLTGSTLTLNPVPISGLNVTLQYFAVPGIALLRTLVTLQNPTGSPIAATVDVPVNFGSDSGSIIRGTSSGDTVVTTADRWVVSSDSGPSDPVLTTVMFNGAAAILPTAYTQTVFNCAAVNGLGATFNLTIPAGQSLSLVFFAGLGGINANNNTVAGALAGAAAIFDTPNALTNAGGFAGLSPQQLASLANWGPIALQSFVIPTLTEWSLLLLSILVAGVAGLVLYRRRRIGEELRA
jgi:hypothetical protein